MNETAEGMILSDITCRIASWEPPVGWMRCLHVAFSRGEGGLLLICLEANEHAAVEQECRWANTGDLTDFAEGLDDTLSVLEGLALGSRILDPSRN